MTRMRWCVREGKASWIECDSDKMGRKETPAIRHVFPLCTRFHADPCPDWDTDERHCRGQARQHILPPDASLTSTRIAVDRR